MPSLIDPIRLTGLTPLPRTVRLVNSGESGGCLASLFKWLEGKPVSLISLLSSSYYYLLLIYYIILPFWTIFGPSLPYLVFSTILNKQPALLLECTSSSLFLFDSIILWSIVLPSACRDNHVLEKGKESVDCSLEHSLKVSG